jgi:hypothetical protein
MQRYRCIKVVEAMKIGRIDQEPDKEPVLYSPDGDYIAPAVGYYTKNSPQKGGYYVRDKDGCESYFPAKAFENGYKAIWAV